MRKKKPIHCHYVLEQDFTVTPLKGRCGANALNDIEQPCMPVPLTEQLYNGLLRKGDYFRLGDTNTVLLIASFAGQYALMPLNRSAAYGILSRQETAKPGTQRGAA